MNSTPNKTQLESEAGELLDHVKDYLETRSEITKLTALDKISQGAGAATSGLIIGFLLFLFFIFSGLAFAYLIAEWSGHYYTGFFSVAGVYLIAGIILIFRKKSWIEIPVANKIIESYFDEHEKQN